MLLLEMLQFCDKNSQACSAAVKLVPMRSVMLAVILEREAQLESLLQKVDSFFEEEGELLEYQQEKKHDDDILGAMRFVKKASQMRGLVFGNKIDALLSGGLAPNTLTFLYGKNADLLMNILCGNSIRIFGERAIFIDAANSF